jgi:anti-sigma B factor antagonist
MSFPDLVEFSLQEQRLPTGAVLVTAQGELDIATAPALRERLVSAIDAGATAVVLDLRSVAFMDSVALAAILHAGAQLAGRGRLAVVVPYDSYTRLVFEIAGMPRCLDLFEELDEAVAHLAG